MTQWNLGRVSGSYIVFLGKKLLVTDLSARFIKREEGLGGRLDKLSRTLFMF